MIEADKLTKYYDDVAAAKDISFQLEKGEILGFLGPNGAGKSTTMKMLTTFLYPTSGTAIVNGYDIIKDPLKVRESIGYLPENAPLYDEMHVEDFLYFAAEARKLSSPKDAVERVLEQCFISDVRHKPIHVLSKGYRQRVCFAQAIIHDPSILILDEPTAGLDPNQKAKVREMISAMGEGKAILLSTHILDEATAICDRAIIISKGEIKVDRKLEDLLLEAPGRGRVNIDIRGVNNGKTLMEAFSGLEHVAEIEAKKADYDPSLYKACIYPEEGYEICSSVLKCVKENKWTTASVSVREGQLEDIFRKYTEES